MHRIIVAIAVALCLDRLLTLEWSHDYCARGYDGPGYAYFGAPLPYETFGGASSLHYLAAPHIWAFDIVCMSALAWLVLHPIRQRVHRSTAVKAGVVALLALALRGGDLWMGFWQPRWTITSDYVPASSLRPVGVTTLRFYACTPLEPDVSDP